MYVITYIVFAVLGLISFSAACAAPESKDSPLDIVYGASFLGYISGAVVFYSIDGYTAVRAVFQTAATAKDPFTYRIHDKEPFGACDPRSRTLNPYCGDLGALTPAEKEVGDLSGKHGVIKEPFQLDIYEDRYLSLNPKNKAFFDQMSVVVEDSKGNRLACAVIKQIPVALTGKEAEVAKPLLKLDIPQRVKDLLA